MHEKPSSRGTAQRASSAATSAGVFLIVRWSLALLALASSLAGAQSAPPKPPEAPTELARAIPLFTGEVPGGNGPEQWEGAPGAMAARNITQAALLPVLPDPNKATGAAVVIAPGDDFVTLAWDHEGMKVARAIADHGIAAFVLKYRLEPSPRDPLDEPGGDLKSEVPPYPMQDAVAALRLVRTNAQQWDVDPARVGMLGFSAGARTTLAVTLQADVADRPAFIGLMYPPMARVAAPADAPPMFVAMAADDPLFGRMGYGLIESWVAARRPFEFHVYEHGGHGFGPGFKGTTTEGWIEGLVRWMGMNGFLKEPRTLAHTDTPARAAALPTSAKYSSAETKIGTLLDDPAAKAIVEKYIPGFTTSRQIGMARAMTLKTVQRYAPDTVTDTRLAEIDAELAHLPTK
jgi:acetyl esterase/lipase